MPTLGWIFETAEDRFYERGGYDVLHSPARSDCPICGEQFEGASLVSWHVNERHPLERPMLLVDGAALPSSVVYSVPLNPAAISFANTTTIRASCNGRVLTVATVGELAARIANERRAIFQIELENGRAADAAKVAASYTVMTAIPDESDLEAVDGLFLQHLAVDSPTPSDVRAFADAAGRFGSADRYTDGLAQYVYAILAKEGDVAAGTTLPFEAFQVKIQQALDALSPHQARPVPQAVCAAARLNINDVRRRRGKSGNRTLEGVTALLHALAVGEIDVDASVDGREEPLAAICPIDRDTHLVLRAFDDLYRRRLGSEDPTFVEYVARSEDATLSAFDRTKLHAMLAQRHLSDGVPMSAAPHLQELAHDAIFGRWASKAFDKIGST